MKSTPLLATVAAAAALAAACGGGGGGGSEVGSGGTGTLSVSLTDNPCYDAVNVTIDRLRVHRSADASDTDAGWTDIALRDEARGRVNLLDLRNGVFLKLGDVTLPAGDYTQLRLVLAENAPGTARPANSVVLPGSTAEIPLSTPSAQRSGVKLIRPFTVAPGQIVELALDFDACRSVVAAGNSGRYNLKPTIEVIPLLDVGRITGVAPAGSLVTAQVATETGAPTVVKATTALAQAPGAQEGPFDLYPLPSGRSYTVVIANAERTTSVVRAVPVERQKETVLSATAAALATDASTPAVPVSGTVITDVPDTGFARVLQRMGDVTVEFAGVPVNAVSGAFAFRLPKGAPKVASWTGTGASTTPSLSSFAVAADAEGRYRIVASDARVTTERVASPDPIDVRAGTAISGVAVDLKTP
jgi:hypothetical protein